jgi:serine phosphatase RsbU (regulator of sigma subunit)
VEGNVLGLQGIFWDITQQKLAEEKIRKANAQLAQSRKQLRDKNQEMEDDLRMAREIQLTMLPQSYPVFPRSASNPESAFKFTHRYLPAGTVGGDFFTVSALSETQASVFVCDVAGHGIRSALVTAMIRALVEELKPVATDPGQFLTKLNLDLCSILKNTGSPLLTTAFYLVADAATGRISFANAGHPKPVQIGRGGGEVLPLLAAERRSQPALGLFETATYVASEAVLKPADVLIMFTDGLVEVHNRKEELWTEAQLVASLRRLAQLDPELILDKILAEIKEFSEGSHFDDDVCLVSMEFAGPAEKGA